MSGGRLTLAGIGVAVASLACSGALPEELLSSMVPEPPPVAEGTAPVDAPDDADPTEAPPEARPVTSSDSALFEALGAAVPPGGEVYDDKRTRVSLFHRDAWNVEEVWNGYVEAFEAAGFTRYRTAVPPFEGLFHRGDDLVDLRLQQAGPTVTVQVVLKVRPAP